MHVTMLKTLRWVSAAGAIIYSGDEILYAYEEFPRDYDNLLINQGVLL